MFKRTIILLILFSACTNNKSKSDKQILDFGTFTIETPKTWTKVKPRGIDSYVGYIALDSKDTIGFDLGQWPNNLEELRDIPDTGLVIIDYPDRYLPEIYKKNKILWDTIDGYKVKIVSPKKSGYGTTGIYIDSLWNTFYKNDGFNLYGKNLKPENEKLLLEAVKTIKFHKPK